MDFCRCYKYLPDLGSSTWRLRLLPPWSLIVTTLFCYIFLGSRFRLFWAPLPAAQFIQRGLLLFFSSIDLQTSVQSHWSIVHSWAPLCYVVNHLSPGTQASLPMPLCSDLVHHHRPLETYLASVFAAKRCTTISSQPPGRWHDSPWSRLADDSQFPVVLITISPTRSCFLAHLILMCSHYHFAHRSKVNFLHWVCAISRLRAHKSEVNFLTWFAWRRLSRRYVSFRELRPPSALWMWGWWQLWEESRATISLKKQTLYINIHLSRYGSLALQPWTNIPTVFILFFLVGCGLVYVFDLTTGAVIWEPSSHSRVCCMEMHPNLTKSHVFFSLRG